jgi:hypothetical protein
MKLEYTDLVLPDNTTGWKQGWLYLDNPASALHNKTRRAPVPFLEWTNQLTSRETEELRPLLEDLERLKAEGLTRSVVAINFSCWLIQPIQDRVHPAYEYWGQSNPNPGCQAQCIQRGDGGAGEEHLWRAHPQSRVPQDAWFVLLTVYFGTPNMFITLWFGFDYGTNPPLGTLMT